MERLLACLLGLTLVVLPASGQSGPGVYTRQELQPVDGVVRNAIRVAETAGDSLWVGPSLTVYVGQENSFFAPDDPTVRDRLGNGSSFVLSLAAQSESSPSTVWAGLAFDAVGDALGAGGFLVSTDGGQSFEGRPVHLDEPSDTTITYGTKTLSAVPITREDTSAPQDLALGRSADTVWVAGRRSGLRWSADRGQTWNRAVLPPDTLEIIRPTNEHDFRLGPGGSGGLLNHFVYSVLVDETGTVWAGTAAGVNWSAPADVGPSGDRTWRRFGAKGTPQGLPGQRVRALAEQPRPEDRNPIWMTAAAQDGDQRFGAAVTPDGGDTFRATLIGKRVNDLAARPERVYAATRSGLYVTGNQGRTWRSIEQVRLKGDDQVLPGDIRVLTVEVAPSALWMGTNRGLLRLDRSQEPRLLPDDPGAPPPRWQLFRTEVPVSPENPTEQVPDVETYAYPNPFVPSQGQVVRIVYEVPEPQTVEVNIYDFSMNRVRTLREQESAGRQEMAWDGRGKGGVRLPTGTYLYTVELGGETVRGKILLSN